MPGPWRSALRLVALVAMTTTVFLLPSNTDAAVSASDSSSSGNTKVEVAGEANAASRSASVTTVVPTPTPSPTYLPDDCSPCCSESATPSPWSPSTGISNSSSSAAFKLGCCTSLPRELRGTKNGECSGLPCCKYNGRIAQSHRPWYPCVVFPTCQSDATKAREFCSADWTRSFTGGANFTCTDSCCNGPALDAFVWSGETNAFPGRRDATFAMTFTPSYFVSVFYTDQPAKTLVQLMLASPLGYKFTNKTSCTIEKAGAPTTITVNASKTATPCVVSTYANRTHLTVDLPVAFRSNDSFRVTFDHIVTPSGIDDSTVGVSYSTDRDLAPMYFIFDDPEGGVFNSFYRVGSLLNATLSSGAFLPENIYPGNSGNATLAFYTNARVPRGSTIDLKFGSKWKFTSGAIWSYELFPDPDAEADVLLRSSSAVEDATANASGLSTELAATSASATAPPLSTAFAQATYTVVDNWWSLSVETDIEIGWVSLSVDKVQNPSVSYSGLNFATIQIRDPQRRLVVDGKFSAISVDMASGASASPYNYVTMVVLTCTLLFCTVVIRSNGLAFSLGSIWTDITAICTVLALCTGILNNLVWAFERSSAYFYLSRVYLCFTFTMLTAVCFHWATVLNLRMRKLPKTTTSIAFVVLNTLFYVFQATFLLYHRDLIARVYKSEQDTFSYANQQCKSDDDFEPTASVFSDIQGYLWSCYAMDEDRFFLISTTVTSALFLALTLTVMALGVLVMRRGKLLLVNATGPHQVVLMKALRLYYALIGVVTLVYLLSWVVQILSRTNRYIPYPWYYVFTVWLPYSIPPSCLIFLQWNATAKTLGDADRDSTSSPLSQFGYGEIRTPLFSFSTVNRWSDAGVSIEGEFDDLDDDSDGASGDASDPYTSAANPDDYVGLSMALEMNESFPQGCFIAIQRLEVDAATKASVWRQIGNTDTVLSMSKDSLSGSSSSVGSATGRYVYTFFAVPRIPVSATDERVRMVVYALSTESSSTASDRNDHSEITAETVIAALERRSTGPRDDDASAATTTVGDDGIPTSQRTNASSSNADFDTSGLLSSRAIDELFENESEGDSTEGSLAGIPTFSVVGEFTVTTSALVTAGARCEQVSLVAAEHSYRHVGPHTIPPKLSIHTVIPKTAGAKYGFTAGISGLAASHSISSQYHIREQGLLVVEDLTESRFSNLIPRQILEIIIRHRAKCLLLAEHDIARLEAYDRQRQKGSDRGIYENLIQQIQDDGDLNRCREWMQQRTARMKEYLTLLRRLRRLYVTRDQHKNYFKPSTEKKNALLRFLPINLHLQEMWVGPADTFADSQHSSKRSSEFDSAAGASAAPKASVYDIVTVGAMAAHVYKFKNGGILGLEAQHAKTKPRAREEPGSTAAHHQNPLWTEEEQKAENLEWEIQQRMDVCFPQAVAALVTAFTRKVDLALQHAQPDAGSGMLEQMEKLGFLFNVESLVSTHGNEAGMLEDMAGAVNELRNIRFVLVDENDDDDEEEDDADDDRDAAHGKAVDRATSLTFHMEDETKEPDDSAARVAAGPSSPTHSGSSSSSTGIAGVVDVNVFTNLDDALSVGSNGSRRGAGDDTSSDAHGKSPHSPMSRGASISSSFSGVGQRLLSTLIKAKNHKLLGGIGGTSASSLAPASADKLFAYTHLVIRIKVRSSKHVKLTESLRHGGVVKVCPVLFSQGINEKQTLANNTGSSVTRLQDVINENSLRSLRAYCDRFCNYQASLQSRYFTGTTAPASRHGAATVAALFRDVPTRDEVTRILNKLEKLISLSRQTRKKRPEILQLSSDLCRRVSGGRVTVCKSAKDRTGMSVTLEQGRILVQNHGLPEAKKAGIVAVMRSEGVRIENALKNTGRRVFAFNALQRSLMPEEYRCPHHTGGRNMS